MATKQINWVAIKKRYLKGEKPKDIAADYGLTAKQVSDKSQREGWKRKKEEISEKIQAVVEDDLKELCDLTIQVHKEFMRNLKGQIKNITNPYLLDGERTNSLFQTAMNNSVKVMMGAMKMQEEKQEDGAQTSNPVYRSIYQNCQFDASTTGNFASKAIVPVESGNPGEEEWEDDSSD